MNALAYSQPSPGRPQSSRGAQRANTQSQPAGPKVISESLLMEIADDLTAGNSGQDQPGAISINTASAEVLACLPGVSRELAQAIIAYRRSAGFFPNIAWLLKVDGMSAQIFKQIGRAHV